MKSFRLEFILMTYFLAAVSGGRGVAGADAPKKSSGRAEFYERRHGLPGDRRSQIFSPLGQDGTRGHDVQGRRFQRAFLGTDRDTRHRGSVVSRLHERQASRELADWIGGAKPPFPD